MSYNQKAFDLVAGGAVFVGITLVLADTSPDLAYAILLSALGYLVLSHTQQVFGFISNYRNNL